MSSATETAALFTPIQVGDIKLSHRVVLAPLTRLRADAAHVPTDLIVEHYKQRSKVPGTLLITEATIIAPEAGGLPHAPGIWNEQQIAAWKKVVEAVHANKSYIYLQLWALGRTAREAVLKAENPELTVVSASDIPLSERPENVPRPLTIDEIKQYTQWYATAAKNAVEGAGFDGVEIHGANGYLLDQFLQDVSNKRTDEYGGSIENRARFSIEVMEAVSAAVGQSKSAIRLSPWSMYQDMRMEDPIPTFTYLVEQFKARLPKLAFLHVVAPGAVGNRGPEDAEMVDFIHKLWAPRPTVTTGGYTRESGLKVAQETGQIIGYGTAFLSNPDLPFRLQKNIELNIPDQSTFYTIMSADGYTTYPFSNEFLGLTTPKPTAGEVAA